MTLLFDQRSTPVLADHEVLPAVRSVRTIVESGAAAAEETRTLPRPTVDAIAGAGLFALRAPREVGGSDIDPLTALAAYEEMASYDTAAGWSMAIASAGSALLGARLSELATGQVFGGGVPLVAGTFAPTGSATQTDGGYRVSGRWSFTSGIHHADWLTGACVVAAGDEPPQVVTIVVPRSAVDVIDEWYVAGLQGTGSCDWTVSEHAVEDAYVIRPFEAPLRGGPAFRMPLLAFIGVEHAGFALGCARRALLELTSSAGSKVRLLSTSSVAERSAFQRDLGRAEAALRAARLLVVDVLGTAWTTACRGDAVTPLMEAETRMAAVHVTNVAVDICTLAFRSLGARVLHLTNPVQRYFRDIHAAAQHVYVADTAFEELARMRLGIDRRAGVRPATDVRKWCAPWDSNPEPAD